MTEPYSPVAVEEAIRKCANNIAKGVSICSERYAVFMEADRSYEWAYAAAYNDHDGAAHEKKYYAILATKKERTARDTADVAYRFADRTARALEAELRAWQSVNKSVIGMYGAAGVGER